MSKLYIPRVDIDKRIYDMSEDILKFYARNHPPALKEGLVIVAVLKGAAYFAVDLSRALYSRGILTEMEYVGIKSYKGPSTVSNNSPTMYLKPTRLLTGKHILVVDDIADTCQTLYFLRTELVNLHNPASIHSCVLLEKETEKACITTIAFRGFRIADVFVVGYGLDHDEDYRYLQHIQEIDPKPNA